MAGPVNMPVGPVDGCFGGMHGVTKHADYLAPPDPPRPAGYDSFALQNAVADTLYKQASHGTQVSGADGPAVRMEYPDILGTEVDRQNLIHKQAAEALLGRLQVAMLRKQAADENLYRQVRQQAVEGTKIEELVEYLQAIMPTFRSTAEGEMPQEVRTLLERLKADGIMNPRAVVLREDTRPGGKAPVRVVNMETPVATAAQEVEEAKFAVTVLAEALEKEAQVSRMFRSAGGRTMPTPAAMKVDKVDKVDKPPAPPKMTQAPKPIHTDITGPINDYPPDWKQIADKYKEDQGWQCEACYLDLDNQKSFLHVHHKNGLKYDNDPENHLALCIACHADEPQHQHLKSLSDYEECRRMRNVGGYGYSGYSGWNFSDWRRK